MKKIIYITFLIVIIFIYNSSLSIATTTATVNLTSNKNIIENEEEIQISFNITGQKTASYLANIYFDNTLLDFVSGPENIVVDKNNIKILWYDVRWRKWSKTRRTW